MLIDFVHSGNYSQAKNIEKLKTYLPMAIKELR